MRAVLVKFVSNS